MKTTFFQTVFIGLACTVCLTSCSDDDAPGTNNTTSGSTSGTTAGNYFIIEGITSSQINLSCDNDSAMVGYRMLASGANGDSLGVFLGAQPTATATYTVVHPYSFSGQMPANQAVITASKGGNKLYLSNGGQVTATIVGGKVKIDFIGVDMEEWQGNNSSSVASGSLTCD